MNSYLLTFSDGKFENCKVNKDGDKDFLLENIAAFLLEICKLYNF